MLFVFLPVIINAPLYYSQKIVRIIPCDRSMILLKYTTCDIPFVFIIISQCIERYWNICFANFHQQVWIFAEILSQTVKVFSYEIFLKICVNPNSKYFVTHKGFHSTGQLFIPHSKYVTTLNLLFYCVYVFFSLKRKGKKTQILVFIPLI